MMRHVGVVVVTCEGSEPLVYATAVKDSWDDAYDAGIRKAGRLLRMSALVASSREETDDMVAAAERVARYGRASWTREPGRPHAREAVLTVSVSESSDDVLSV